MKHLRDVKFDEYVEWYLLREKRKNPCHDVPGTAETRLDLMRRKHKGKLRDWFDRGHWSIVLLEFPEELESLIFYEGDWTRSDGLIINDGTPDYRLLRRVVERAIAVKYLETTKDPRHLAYFTAFKECHFRLEGNSRLVICSANADEKRTNPGGQYYLHDGSGRGLAYMLAIKQGGMAFEPVESFLTQK